MEDKSLKNIFDLRLRFPEISIENAHAIFELRKMVEKLPKKIPSWVNKGVVMPNKALQQCTSEAVASYKASLFGGGTMIDITGGIGVDDWAFSKYFNKIISYEIDPEIHACAVHNLSKLGIKNVERILGNASAQIEQLPKADLIYIDPDRRISVSKGIAIDQMEPNLTEIIPVLWHKTDDILLKLSPLFDIKMCLSIWSNIAFIKVISEKNDVKEITILLKKEFNEKTEISAINIDQDQIFEFSQNINQLTASENNDSRKHQLHEGSFLHFPLHALIKANLADTYFEKYQISKLVNTPYYISMEPVFDNACNVYQILAVLKTDKKSIKNYCKSIKNLRASLIVKGMKLENREKWIKDIGLKEGGKDLFLMHNANKIVTVYHLVPVNLAN